MKITCPLFLICAALLQSSRAADRQWQTLFNGNDTAGWEMVGPGALKLENHELVTYGGMGMLWYNVKKFGNCELRVLFKPTEAKDNSGIFIRMPERPKNPFQAVNQGYEVQIDNTEDDYHRTGCLYSLTLAKDFTNAKINEWNEMLITLDGPRTIIKLNGRVVTDYSEADPVPTKKIWYEPDRGRRPNEGYIGLQNHGGEVHVHFKEVSVRSLPRKDS